MLSGDIYADIIRYSSSMLLCTIQGNEELNIYLFAFPKKFCENEIVWDSFITASKQKPSESLFMEKKTLVLAWSAASFLNLNKKNVNTLESQ